MGIHSTCETIGVSELCRNRRFIDATQRDGNDVSSPILITRRILSLSPAGVKVRKAPQTETKTRANDATSSSLSVFSTKLGWCGLVGQWDCVTALTFGHDTPVQVRLHLEAKVDLSDNVPEWDWSPDVRERLQAYAAGATIDFSDIVVDTTGLTSFRRSVITALRHIGYGQTVSYAQLAALAGSPRAARAVGSAMAMNRVPLIVPCHRVVASGGRLGGFSAPSGLTMKQRLLELEDVTEIQFGTTPHEPISM